MLAAERWKADIARVVDARDVPAYIIFSDVALREMARRLVASVEMRHVIPAKV